MKKIYSNEIFNGEIYFYINGERYNAEDFNLCIPNGYKHVFCNASFNSTHELSLAIAYARCANEARNYNVPHLVRENEVALSHLKYVK